MFVDGLWYATIANNLSNGLGSFWQPMLTETMAPEFYSHPPLVFGLQSIFFNVFGHGLFVEKIYATLTFLLTMLMIHKVWREINFDNEKLKKLSFVPLILWFLCERTYVNFPNNLLECTQGVFILSSILFILKGIRFNNRKSNILFLIAGLFLALSFLSKGYTGLFPLIVIVLHQFYFRAFTFLTSIKYSIVLFFGLLFPLGLLFLLVPESLDFIINYTELQVLGSLKGETYGNVRTNRFFIVKRFIESNIAPMILVLLVSMISYFKFKTKGIFQNRKETLFFMTICLIGFLPYTIAKKQAAYYIITSVPYFAIALSFIFIRSESLIDKLKGSKIFTLVSILVLITASINLYNIKDDYNRRNRVLLQDFDVLETQLEEIKGTTIGAITKRTHDSSYGYMMRMYSISMDTVNPYKYDVIFSNKDSVKDDTTTYLTKQTDTKEFNLFYKK